MEYENGQIFLVIKETRDATQVYWDGTHTLNEWNLNENENFNNAGEADIFVSGDDVVFDDAATDTSVRINENLYPKTVTFDNDTKTYSLSGNGGISGETGLTKKGTEHWSSRARTPTRENNVRRRRHYRLGFGRLHRPRRSFGVLYQRNRPL